MKINISHIAKLAYLPLSDEEKTTFEKQLESTLEKINDLKEVNTTNIEPTSQVTGLTNITRVDVADQSFSQEQATKNAKSVYNGLFKVKAILEQE